MDNALHENPTHNPPLLDKLADLTDTVVVAGSSIGSGNKKA